MKFKNAFRFTENTDAMIAFWDKELVCRFANAAYQKWFGIAPEDMIDKVTLPELLGPIYELNLTYIRNALDGKMQVFERTLTQVDGTISNTLATYTPEIMDGEVIGFFAHVVDISIVKPSISRVDNELNLVSAMEMDSRLNNVERTLRNSLFTQFPGVEKLAKENFISATKLKGDFKKRFGMPIFSYYRVLQMQIADKYLRETTYSKKQIAAMFGFSNQSNFLACYNRYVKK